MTLESNNNTLGRKRAGSAEAGQGIPSAMMVTLAAALGTVAMPAVASENVPQRPFAYLANTPSTGQFIAGLVYEESEAYHILAPRTQYDVNRKVGGENYGIDATQGFVTVQYGLSERWSLDLSAGATTVGSRSFSNGAVDSTTGLMDVSFGVRYVICTEDSSGADWKPTLVFRAGAVLPGTYDKDSNFAPGMRSAAISPEFIARKHFGWTGLGAYTDLLYRWNKTIGNDQYIASVGIFQEIKSWELDLGYRHVQSLAGDDIQYDPANPAAIAYPRNVREINDAIEAGFSYTTSKHHLRLGFHTRTIVDGSNTDRKFWIGASVDLPLGPWTK